MLLTAKSQRVNGAIELFIFSRILRLVKWIDCQCLGGWGAPIGKRGHRQHLAELEQKDTV